ncbi:MAG TPA: multidrug efflux SMR transporter [Thermoanaerobaculia bacterium]
MSWLYLIVAGLLEVAWAATMKSTQGFTKLGPSLLTLGLMGVSFYLLSLAMRDLPTSSSYAIWVGIGAVGTAIVGLFFLGEERSPLRLISIALIVLGVIGLRLAERR